MNEKVKRGLRHHVTAAARDIAVVVAVLGSFGSFVAWSTTPIWRPFAELPAKVANIEATVTRGVEHSILDVEGNAFILDGDTILSQGDTITLAYWLRRNASCDTLLTERFFDIDRGLFITAETHLTTKAPVGNWIPFKIGVKIPETLPSGRYVYAPTLKPLDCGVYSKEIAVPMSEVFRVQ